MDPVVHRQPGVSRSSSNQRGVMRQTQTIDLLPLDSLFLTVQMDYNRYKRRNLELNPWVILTPNIYVHINEGEGVIERSTYSLLYSITPSNLKLYKYKGWTLTLFLITFRSASFFRSVSERKLLYYFPRIFGKRCSSLTDQLKTYLMLELQSQECPDEDNILTI